VPPGSSQLRAAPLISTVGRQPPDINRPIQVIVAYRPQIIASLKSLVPCRRKEGDGAGVQLTHRGATR
jgi:hypothetical protein